MGAHVEMRIIEALSGLVLACGGTYAFLSFDASRAPEQQAFRGIFDPANEVHKTVDLSRESVRRDPANAYRWADLGEALERAGEVEHAGYAFRRAVELGPALPQILVRNANFHFQQGEVDDGLAAASKVLKIVPDYDGALFNLFDQLADGPGSVLRHIGSDRRAAGAYTRHVISAGPVEDATLAWDQLHANGFDDTATTTALLDALLKAKLYSQAQERWVKYTTEIRGDYPEHNLLFNGDFEREPTGSAFDWRIGQINDVQVIRDKSVAYAGKVSLRIRFSGTSNISYRHLNQLTRVTPGRYLLQAWIRSEDITTNEGPRLRVIDPESPSLVNVSSEAVTGTMGWSLITLPISVSAQTNLLEVQVIREPSLKLDNKIAGTFWLDNVSLTKDDLDKR